MEAMLTEAEARVLGCLVEKHLTTPDYYPLTLNALTNACAQKNNRDPVVEYPETSVVRALDRLRDKGLAEMAHLRDSRVAKYMHHMPERLGLSGAETAIIAELLLRGAQTPGELRSRAERMHRLAGLEEVEAAIAALMGRDQPLIVKLPRRPGQKEHRYMHTLCGAPEDAGEEAPEPLPEPARVRMIGEDEAIRELKAEVARLSAEFDALRAEFATFKKQFD